MPHKLTTSLLTTVEYHIDQVANSHGWQLMRPGSAPCVHRRAVAGVKYAEGQLVALTKVRRALRRRQETHEAEWACLLVAELNKWVTLLAGYRQSTHPEPEWAAYAQGGVDAISNLIATAKELHAA